ncbi:MAG: transcriptional regulator with XRE-family HTH domain [Hyphomicrobiaceae bacterium]
MLDYFCYFVYFPTKFRVTFVAISAILLANMTKKNSDIRSRFAQRLRAIRIPRGFKTARSFAEALEIDENRYTRYERAEVEPDLQLLMRICNLLSATPNDLLCDTIGAPPVELDMPYGFAEQAAGTYIASGAVAQQRQMPAAVPHGADALAEARKAIAWDLATVIAAIEAGATGLDLETLPVMEKLRRVPPIHARITSDVFRFLQELPDRLQGKSISTEQEQQIDRLTREIITASKPPSNDND